MLWEKRISGRTRASILGCMPRRKDRTRFLKGPYEPPAVRIGQRVWCALRKDKVRVCNWNDGRIPWPRGRVGWGGKGAYIVTPTLVRAIRTESESALLYWFGFSRTTIGHWRRALGVPSFNEGTRQLYSLWKPVKLPDHTVCFSPAALRRMRLRGGWTMRQVAEKMGWTSVNSYGQMESGRRVRSTRPTLGRLAKVLNCSVSELLER